MCLLFYYFFALNTGIECMFTNMNNGLDYRIETRVVINRNLLQCKNTTALVFHIVLFCQDKLRCSVCVLRIFTRRDDFADKYGYMNYQTHAM